MSRLLNLLLSKTLLSRIFSLGDYVLFSIANFALTITLSRSFSHETFAGFGVGLSAALMLQGLQRGLYVAPAILLTKRAARRYGPGITGEHLIVVSVIVATCLAWLIGDLALGAGELSIAAALSTLACAITYLQADFDRMLQVKRGLTVGPAIISAAYFAAIAAICGLVAFEGLPYWAAMLMLAGFGLAKALVVMMLTSRPNLRWGVRFLKQDLRLRAPFSMTGALAYAGYNHVPLMILASNAPPVQAAAFVAMRSLAQPLQTVVRALDIADKNTVRARAGGTTKGLRNVFWRTQSIYMAVVVAMLVLIAAFAPFLVRVAYGDKYAGLEYLAVWHCAVVAMLAFMLPIESVVNILRNYSEHLRWRLASATAGVALSVLLCGRFGAYGAATASLAGWAIAIVGGLFVIRHVVVAKDDLPIVSERRSAWA